MGHSLLLVAVLSALVLGLAGPAGAQARAGDAPAGSTGELPGRLPEGLGLAAAFPGDEGIGAHPAVVFFEDFEVDDVSTLKERWSTVHGPDTLSLSEEAPPGSPGGRALRVDAKRGDNTGGYVYKALEQGYEKLHMRFYVKFAEDHPYSHHFVRMGGLIDPPPYPLGGAGKRPVDSFTVGLDAVRASGNTYPAVGYPPPGVWGFYNYWPEMRSWQSVLGIADPDNPSYYGNGFYPDPPVPIPRGEWISVEIMTKLNSTPEASDGEIALWINGRLVAHFGPGTVRGYWVRDQFRTDPSDVQSRPFEGFRWRNRADLLINTVKLENYLEERAYVWAEEWLRDHPDTHVNLKESTVWFDHFVVATEYIGPMVPAGADGTKEAAQATDLGEETSEAVGGDAAVMSAGAADAAVPAGGLSGVYECANPKPAWIWCDDFEEDRLAGYFEYTSDGGAFARAEGVGLNGSYGMRQRWLPGQVAGGTLKLAFGKTAEAYVRPVDDGTAKYREIYWRLYLKHEENWEGGGAAKLSRATVLVENWAQAMIAHVWSAGGPPGQDNYLSIDLASGTDLVGNLKTTKYNDFDNLRWLGNPVGKTPIFDRNHVGQWYCIESYVRLNDPGEANGVQRLWINGVLEAERTGVNWLGAYDAYGINALFVENYWNSGSPKAQERYFDNLVVSTEPIGCIET